MPIEKLLELHMQHDEVMQRSIDLRLQRMEDKLDIIVGDVAGLKAKAVVWGSIGGLFLGGLATWVTSSLL